MKSGLLRRLSLETAKQFAKVAFSVLLGGLAGATLARYSAGFGVDERELDARLNSASIEAVRHGRSEGRNLASFYVSFLKKASHGDLGYSVTLNRPINELIRQRASLTAREMVRGLALAAAFAGLLACLTRNRISDLAKYGAELLSGVSVCIPAALLGYACLLVRAEPYWAVTLCTFPYLFRYLSNMTSASARAAYVLAARARGIANWRLQIVHVLFPTFPQALALMTTTVSIAFGAAIPIEVVTQTPGLGQLAWHAASSRDLPLLCVVTMIVTGLVLATSAAHAMARAALARPDSL